MQHRLNCAWRYLSYNADHGRAEETLFCALRQRLYGRQNIWPVMDWDSCLLTCGSFDQVDLARVLAEPQTLSVSSYGHTMYRLMKRHNNISKTLTDHNLDEHGRGIAEDK